MLVFPFLCFIFRISRTKPNQIATILDKRNVNRDEHNGIYDNSLNTSCALKYNKNFISRMLILNLNLLMLEVEIVI